MITPNGRYLGRLKDTQDDRDHPFLKSHPEAAHVHLPPSVDLRRPPPCFDQGESSTCGPQSGDRFMIHMFPEMAETGFSRLQMYRDIRVIEGTGDGDVGVETRDVFKTLQQTGAAPENLWPFDLAKLADVPGPEVYVAAAKYKLGSYSRLTTATNYLQCLASGFPFIMGVDLYASFDDDETARTGMVRMPQPSEQIVGGHDLCVEGYVLNFKSDPVFIKSGVDPVLVDDIALLVPNSWGPKWTPFRGYCFYPLALAADPVHGNDVWTGRKAS